MSGGGGKPCHDGGNILVIKFLLKTREIGQSFWKPNGKHHSELR